MKSSVPLRLFRNSVAFFAVVIVLAGTILWRVRNAQSAAMQGILESTIFDTGIANGTKVNALTWTGNRPAGTTVQFQIASSNSSTGPWSYIGPDGTGTTYLQPDAGVSEGVGSQYHAAVRYFRYKVILSSDAAQTATPRVDSITINWSP